MRRQRDDDKYHGLAVRNWMSQASKINLQAETNTMDWRGASVSSVDGDVADGIRPSHCERGDVDT